LRREAANCGDERGAMTGTGLKSRKPNTRRVKIRMLPSLKMLDNQKSMIQVR